MKPYQERLIAEKQELEERLSKLMAFLENKEQNISVPAEDFALLQRQSGIMEQYLQVLNERIARFQ